jgi:hypothetical protein
VKRAYWVCVLHERLFDVEFRVASTGVESLQDRIPLPHFDQKNEREGPHCNRSREFRSAKLARPDDLTHYFGAMITLSRLIRRISNIVHEYELAGGEATSLRPVVDESGADQGDECFVEDHQELPLYPIEELCRQLDCWRDALPQGLKWDDNAQVEYTSTASETSGEPWDFFGQLRNLEPYDAHRGLDLILAHLRARYYHARLLLYRLFLYKALHKPRHMTDNDRERCVLAFRTACFWPSCLMPLNDRKHLLPQLFSWTQSSLSLTLLLRACCLFGSLEDIGSNGGEMRARLERSVDLIIAWLEGVRHEDGVADWGLKVFGACFALHSFSSRAIT